MKNLCVAGSINADLTMLLPRYARPGETIHGLDFNIYPGGKGCNQAVALATLGAAVSMVGAVGPDELGERMLANLKARGVNTAFVEIAEKNTGVAMIIVSGETGQNSIMVYPGANDAVTVSYAEKHIAAIDSADILLLQLEIPMDTVVFLAHYAHARGKTVVLDPAPACTLPDELLEYVDIITPNETELQTITGLPCDSIEQRTAACKALHNRGVACVINKSGGDGAYLSYEGTFRHVPGFPVSVVDTTAAGDSFNAGLAFSLARGLSMEECVVFANATGAMATTGMGAQSAMPTYDQCMRLIRENPRRP
jgi:ribokinase